MSSITTLFLLLCAASVTDLFRHRIPNLLSLGGVLIGIGLQFGTYGASGVLNGLVGLVVGLSLLLPFYIGGVMGAGDIKLMAAAGVFLGWPNSLLAVGLSLVAGSVIGVALLTARGGLGTLLRRYAMTFKSLFFTGQFLYLPAPAGDAATSRFPYAIAIAAGTVWALWWSGDLSPLIQALRSVPHG